MKKVIWFLILSGCNGGGNQLDGCRDGYEPNDDRASATALAAGQGVAGGACAGEEDWYAVTVGAGEVVRATATFEGAPESLRLSLHESKFGQPIARGVAGGGGLEASAQPGAAGSYFVRIVGGSEDVAYRLAVELSPAAKGCPAGQHPQNGGCVLDGCDDLGLEANDEVETARALLPGSYQGLQICDGDRDFYQLVPPPGGGVVSVSLFLADDARNLNIYLTDGTEVSAGKLKTLAAGDDDSDQDHIVHYPVGDGDPLYLLVSGVRGTVGGYRLEVVVDPIDPKRDCLRDCAAILPMPGSVDPEQPEAIMDGYFVGTEERYAFARRDLAMWLQWSFAEVSRKFPGTHPVYQSDISQENGKTPGTDRGSPRHPTTTHVNGRDCDIAYYQTGEDNDYRIICGKGTDRNGNGEPGKYNDGYFCTTKENIIDMPREVYFLGMLVGHPLFRVVGVDETLPKQIWAEAEKQEMAGDLPPWARYRLEGGLGYGDAGGWAFHHHHVHLSLFDR